MEDYLESFSGDVVECTYILSIQGTNRTRFMAFCTSLTYILTDNMLKKYIQHFICWRQQNPDLL